MNNNRKFTLNTNQNIIVEFTDEEIIQMYHAHGECEQFHSEIKTDQIDYNYNLIWADIHFCSYILPYKNVRYPNIL